MPIDEAYAESVVEHMRAMLKKRGAEGIRGLARNFKICDTNGSGKLDYEELSKCFRLCKLNLSSDQTETVLAYFDRRCMPTPRNTPTLRGCHRCANPPPIPSCADAPCAQRRWARKL